MVALALTTLLASAAPVTASPAAAAPAARSREVLAFIADDYPKALQLARERKLPIFIEAWAPW